MKEKSGTGKTPKDKADKKDQDLPGYPIYPANEDIFNKDEETDLDPENTTKSKKSDPKAKESKTKDLDLDDEDMVGDDLDMPDMDEEDDIALEDEENGYFSLGGDDHNDLDEDIEDDFDHMDF